MIVTDRLIKVFKGVIKHSRDKNKIVELAKIVGSNQSHKTLKESSTMFYKTIKGKNLNLVQSQKIIEWCESYIYKFPNKNKTQHTIATGIIKDEFKSSIVIARAIDVFFDDFLNNIEFDNINNVSFQQIEIDFEVQNAKAN